MVVLEELSQTAPGSLRWLTWRDLFHLVDIACCCAILFPIVWSIRHLRQARRSLFMFMHMYVCVYVFILCTHTFFPFFFRGRA